MLCLFYVSNQAIVGLLSNSIEGIRLSPFSIYFHDLRRRHRVSQKYLARMMGYEQGFISAMEIGRKGPPNDEFVTRLIRALRLEEREQAALMQAVAESQRRYVLPDDAATDVYRMVHKLWKEIDSLHPAQIRMINEILSLNVPEMALNRGISEKLPEEANM